MIKTTLSFLQNFSNREIAIAFWVSIGLIWGLSQSKLRKSLVQLIKAFFAWKLTLSYLAMILYIVLMIFPLKAIGAWEMGHIKLTLLWGVCVGFVMLFEFSKADNADFFRNAIKSNLKGLVIIEFLVNFYVLNLLAELLLAPVFFLLGGMLAVSESDAKYASVNKFLNRVLAFIGLSFTAYAIYMVIVDFEHFATLETLSSFYLPILFTVMFLPFVYLVALFSGYEAFFTRLHFFVSDQSVLRYAQMRTLLVFKLNLWKLNKWSQYIISSWRFKSKKEVDEAVISFKNTAS